MNSEAGDLTGTEMENSAEVDETQKDEWNDQKEKLENEIQDLKDRYLRQAAEFDNYRKRTAKERIELIQTAGKDVIQSLLEVQDDCDRAEIQLEINPDSSATREGVVLVFNKLRNILHSRGLKPMEVVGAEFDADLHEAITSVPAAVENAAGKIVDEVQKGYYLNDRIIRFAKVVVAK